VQLFTTVLNKILEAAKRAKWQGHVDVLVFGQNRRQPKKQEGKFNLQMQIVASMCLSTTKELFAIANSYLLLFVSLGG